MVGPTAQFQGPPLQPCAALWGRDSLPAHPCYSPLGSARAKQGILYNWPLHAMAGPITRLPALPPLARRESPATKYDVLRKRPAGGIPPPLGLPSPFRAGEPAPRAVRAGRLTPLGAAPPRYHSRHDRRKDQAERVASLRHAAAMMYGNHRGRGPLIARYYLRQHTIMCNMYI